MNLSNDISILTRWADCYKIENTAENSYLFEEYKMAIKDSTLKAKQIIDEHPDACILDVREEEEYLAGHIKGAILLPVDDIDALTASDVIPSKDSEVLIYCRSGARSRLASDKLAGLGYEHIYDLGGLTGWPYGLESGWF